MEVCKADGDQAILHFLFADCLVRYGKLLSQLLILIEDRL